MSGDKLRDFYERGYASSSIPTTEQLERMVASSANRIGAGLKLLPAGDSLLDVGCGPGTLLWGSRSRYSRLVGLDISASQLLVATEVLANCNAELLQVDIEDHGIPFGDGEFDAVVCLVVLEFVFSPERVLSEIRRVLSPRGVAIVSVGNIVSLRNRLRTLIGRAPYTSRFAGAANGGVLNWFGPSEFISLVTNADLKVLRMVCSGRWAGLRRVRPHLFGDDLMFVLAHNFNQPTTDGGQT